MNLRNLTLTLMLAAAASARTKTDLLVMRNGDRLTCEIKKLDRGVLYASIDYIDGTIPIEWAKVARVESKQLFLVHTRDGLVYEGTLRTSEHPGQEPVSIEVAGLAERPVQVTQLDVVELEQTAQVFWRRFSGHVDSGLIYTKGNNTTQYNIASGLTYRKERWTITGGFSSALSSTEEASTTTRNQLSINGLRLMKRSHWFYSSLANFLQSSQQGIRLQTSLGGGLGRYFLNSNRARVFTTGGLVWQGTKYDSADAVGNQNAIAGLAAGGAELFYFKKTVLSLSANLLPVLSETGRVRFNTDMSYSVQIINNLWWRVSFYGNWDNRPPAKFSGSDYGTSSSISWSFN